MLVGFASLLGRHRSHRRRARIQSRIFIGVFVGAVTFTGSVIAFGKLRGMIRSSRCCCRGGTPSTWRWCWPVSISARSSSARGPGGRRDVPLLICTVLACLVGIHLVMAVGGADMPIVVSMLNTYSGWAASAAGFMLVTTC